MNFEVQNVFFQNCDLHLFNEEQLLELHRGQGMDIWFRDNFTCPTEDEYKTMVYRKTGALFGLAIRLMQLFSNSTKDFQPLYEKLGLLFQIRDDFANLCSKEVSINKFIYYIRGKGLGVYRIVFLFVCLYTSILTIKVIARI